MEAPAAVNMSAKSAQDPQRRRAGSPVDLRAALRRAEWRYNADADEMNVLLPGWQGREGRAVLVDDELYVRLDAETGRPLSVLIPAYTYWLARQLAQPTALDRGPLLKARVEAGREAAERRAARRAVEQAMRARPELAAAVGESSAGVTCDA